MGAPYDRLVARCRHRPVARGAVSLLAATHFTIAQSIIGAIILYQLLSACILPVNFLIMTMGLYPFAKRITNYPQVLLGFSLALGQLIGAAAMGMDPLHQTQREVIAAMGCFYASNVVNAVIYDAIYAHQDLNDDIKVGVKSVAVAWQQYTKPVLCLLSVTEVVLLGAAGYFIRTGPIYFTSAVAGTAAVLGTMIRTVDLDVPEDCWWWFKWTIWLTGGTLAGGLLVEYLLML